MLSLLPAFDRVKRVAWIKAALKGVGPVVIGMLTLTIVRMVPSALPDLLAASLALAAIVIMSMWRHDGPLPLMTGGGIVGLILGHP